MTIVDIDLFRSYMSVAREGDVEDDALLALALGSAEELISEMTCRQFTLATGVDADRPFSMTAGDLLLTDDYVSLTAVTSYGQVLDPASYRAEPAPTGHAYSAIRRHGYWWPSTWDQVTVTADWGWAAIPSAVQQACLILAKDIAANQSVTYGIAAFTEYGGVRARENPQVNMLLAPYALPAMIH